MLPRVELFSAAFNTNVIQNCKRHLFCQKKTKTKTGLITLRREKETSPTLSLLSVLALYILGHVQVCLFSATVNELSEDGSVFCLVPVFPSSAVFQVMSISGVFTLSVAETGTGIGNKLYGSFYITPEAGKGPKPIVPHCSIPSLCHSLSAAECGYTISGRPSFTEQKLDIVDSPSGGLAAAIVFAMLVWFVPLSLTELVEFIGGG